MSKVPEIGASSRMANFPKEFRLSHQSPSMESKYVCKF